MQKTIDIIDYVPNMVIKKPCIIRNMPDAVYHKCKGLSRSGLKLLLDSPAKYYYKYISGEYTEPEKEKTSFKIGKAAHKYILEGADAFEKKYWHNPFSELTKKELEKLLAEKYGYREKGLVCDLMDRLLEFEGIKPKEIELSKSEINTVIGLARAIKQNKDSLRAFSQKGESELSIFWVDKETGLWLKCRPDFLPYNCALVPDYKTTTDAKPEKVWSDIIDYGYYMQAAMYRCGIEAVTGIAVEEFFIILQEKTPPFISQIYVPDTHLIEIGEKHMRLALEKYLECQKTGIWPGYFPDIIQMSFEPRPDDISTNFDPATGTSYAPWWVDAALSKYEV